MNYKKSTMMACIYVVMIIMFISWLYEGNEKATPEVQEATSEVQEATPEVKETTSDNNVITEFILVDLILMDVYAVILFL